MDLSRNLMTQQKHLLRQSRREEKERQTEKLPGKIASNNGPTSTRTFYALKMAANNHRRWTQIVRLSSKVPVDHTQIQHMYIYRHLSIWITICDILKYQLRVSGKIINRF